MQGARRGIKGVLLDLSGTLHVENTATPSAVAALDKCVQLSEMQFIPTTYM